MRTLSRIMLVVVLLLLPVFMTGASLDVPGMCCSAQNCCTLADCHGHEAEHSDQHIQNHHHHSHCHDRISILHDAGARHASPELAGIPHDATRCHLVRDARLWTQMVHVSSTVQHPPYPGYRHPQRC